MRGECYTYWFFWRTEKRRTLDLRGGAFSICLILVTPKTYWHVRKYFYSAEFLEGRKSFFKNWRIMSLVGNDVGLKKNQVFF